MIDALKKLKNKDFIFKGEIKYPLFFYSKVTYLLVIFFAFGFFIFMISVFSGWQMDKSISILTNQLFSLIFALVLLTGTFYLLKRMYTTIVDDEGITIIPHLGYFLTLGHNYYRFEYSDIQSLNVKILRSKGKLGLLSAASLISIKTKERDYTYMPNAGYNTDELLLLASLKNKLKNKFK